MSTSIAETIVKTLAGLGVERLWGVAWRGIEILELARATLLR